MTFSLHQVGVVAQPPNTHPLAHIPSTCFLIFIGCEFFSLPQPHHIMASHPSPSDNSPERLRAVEKKNGGIKNSIIYICTRDLHSFLTFAHCRAASTIIPLLPKAIFTPSTQPNLGLSCTRPPLTSAINTLQAIRYASINSLYVPKPSQSQHKVKVNKSRMQYV